MNPPKKKTSRVAARKKAGGRDFISRHGLVVGIIAVAVIALVGLVAMIGLNSYHGEPVTVTIARDATAEAIGDTLKSRLGDRFGNRVMMLWRLQGGNPAKAYGAYRVDDGLSALRLSRRLATGAQSPVKVTFNAVRRMNRLAERVTRNLEMTPDEFTAACRRTLVDSGFTEPQFPAAFLPDTYEVYWTVSPDRLIDKMLTAYRRFWTPERREKAARLGLTPVEVSTLASIVEEETAKRDEMPVVARLYLNRLAKGMKLQADPTVKFAIGDESIKRLNHSMLSTVSPYNTYIHQGLPPGPIRVPESSTIDAVLNAPPHNYLYMCAKEDFSGYHNFATTFEQHKVFARRYQEELNRRGIH